MQFKTETKVGIFILVSLAVFAYMTFYLGVFRVNLNKYNSYNIYFDDLSGLAKKSDVKIAGVRVGWVDSINLVETGSKARVTILINKMYCLRSDAYAEIRQEGLLGGKYLEIVPGSSVAGDLANGATLFREGKSTVSMEDLLRQVKNITDNIESVTQSLKGVLGGAEQEAHLTSMVNNVSKATENIAAFTHVLSRNEGHIDSMIKDLSEFSHRLDKDFSRISDGIEDVTKHFGAVAKKVNEGDGFLGKLVNDTEVFDNLKCVAAALRSQSELANNLELVVDTHFESMYRPAEFYPLEDSKGYFDLRLHTSPDKFYVLGLMGNIRGNLYREDSYYEYADQEGTILTEQDINDLPAAFALQPPRVHIAKRIPNTYKLELQFGKIYGDIAFRFGLIEGFVGLGVDYEIPFKTDNFRWVTTFEVFDMRGQDRIDDIRPHFKWLNRVFILNNLYVTFGADDFISRRNANAFFGGGIRFNDDDLKQMLSHLSVFAGSIVK